MFQFTNKNILSLATAEHLKIMEFLDWHYYPLNFFGDL